MHQRRRGWIMIRLFALVVMMNIVRNLVAIDISKNWKLYLLYVSNMTLCTGGKDEHS